ncbi:MAG: S49 family peptidase [Psychrobacter alimentarius]
MNLQAKIKRDIRNHTAMACYDLDEQLAAIDFKALSRYEGDDGEAYYTVENGVATIDVRGLLVPETSGDYRSWGVTGYANLADYIQQANDDPTVTSIVLDVDSGGGYIKGIDIATEAIYQSSKPVETFISGDMYSAAYWLGASTNKITAESKLNGVGSIGVFVVHSEESKWLERMGEKITMIRSGKWKGAYNSFTPLSDEEIERLQQGIDESASVFFNHVAAQRNIDVKTIQSWEGDDFTATKAKELGLIDEIADSVSTSNQAIQSNNNPEEYDLNELEKAQAKIAELEKSEAQAKQEAVDAKAAALAAQNKLAEAQASTRQADIDKLAADTKREFSDDDIAAFKAMDESQFKVAVALATPVTPKAPDLPAGLNKAQATNGREGGESKILAAVEAAKAQGAK